MTNRHISAPGRAGHERGVSRDIQAARDAAIREAIDRVLGRDADRIGDAPEA